MDPLRVTLLFCLVFASMRQSQENSIRNSYSGHETFKNLLKGEVPRRPKHSRQGNCLFKDVTYEIGKRWNPDLGAEFGGVQACVICECLAIAKNNSRGFRKFRPKVNCRNFANECPKPTCKNPRKRQNFCCPSCLNDDFEQNIRSNEHYKNNSNKKRKRNYYGFLSCTSDVNNSFQSLNTNHALLQMKKNILHFNVFILGVERPTFIRFHDGNETILEEFEINPNITSPMKHNTKVYGNWSDMPQNFRKILLNGELKISVSFKDFNSKWKLFGSVKPYETDKKFRIQLQPDEGYLSAIKYMEKPATRYLKAADEEHNLNQIDIKTVCVFNQTKYEEGEQWSNFGDHCEMCTCQRGKVFCEREMCMNLNCENKILLPGQCCSVCNLMQPFNANNSCQFDKRQYAPGSKWHPFLPPNGFDLCTTCSCHPTLEVICERKKCPSLNCPSELREMDEIGCCSRCNEDSAQLTMHKTFFQHDSFIDLIESQRLHDEKILRQGGCTRNGQVYDNGAEWHPKIGSLGENKCILCKCSDGASKCTSKICEPQLNCKKLVNISSECCPVCADHQPSVRKSAKILRPTSTIL